ncbi:hypothetical protein [Metakosakonia massiliensis]|uniref:Post-segregation antitoxin CcdA n=1 Tax=Phytobacter massiliensis TaxID=1485952 RepID=A0A6N3FL74_9ENTR
MYIYAGQKRTFSILLSPQMPPEQLPGRAHEAWLKSNKDAIDALNQWVEENGSFSDFQRAF